MILSRKHRFIFLKTNKTAGTSIEIALSNFCGPDDIITPISPVDEELRNFVGHRGPQHHRPAFAEYTLGDWSIALRRMKRKRFYSHMPGREVKLLIGDEFWNSYFKFCFKRNPWDRMLSLYAWRCKSEPKPTLGEFIDSPVPRDLTTRGIDVYTIDGQVTVDRVCKYEYLEAELESVRQRIGLPEKLSLPRAKGSHRIDKRHYREILQPHRHEQIAAMFRREIEMFGYQY